MTKYIFNTYMIYALLEDNKVSVDETTETEAACPCCHSPVIARRGEINIHHWAHKSLVECDSFYEPKTQWHVDMQNILTNYNKDLQEVVIKKNQVKHIADVINKFNCVVECQHSPISSTEIFEREQFYEHMIWLLDGETFGKNMEEVSSYSENGKEIHRVKWKYYRGTWCKSTKGKYLSINKAFFRMTPTYNAKDKSYFDLRPVNLPWYVVNKFESSYDVVKKQLATGLPNVINNFHMKSL